MKAILLLTILFCWVQSFGQVKVRGYYRKDGTYVQPHYRSRPDGNPYNNYSYPGNTNPYTGKTTSAGSSSYSGSYKSVSSGVSRTMFINVDRLTARTGPSTTSNIIAVLKYQNLVELIGIPGSSWYQVRFTFFDSLEHKFRTVDGYIENSYLSSTFPDNPEAPKNKNFSYQPEINNNNPINQGSSYRSISYKREDKTRYVIVDRLIARAEPAHPAKTITTLKYQQLVEVLEFTNSIWCQARFTYFDPIQSTFKTVDGYVERAYLSDEFPDASLPLKNSGAIDETSFKNASSNSGSIINLPIYPTMGYDIKAGKHPYGQGNGQLSIWTNCNDCSDIAIYVNDNYSGTISKYFHNQPDCNTQGIFSIIRPFGKIKLTAISARTGKKWEAYLNVIEDKCTVQQLSK
jgi:hypothetical protein